MLGDDGFFDSLMGMLKELRMQTSAPSETYARGIETYAAVVSKDLLKSLDEAALDNFAAS